MISLNKKFTTKKWVLPKDDNMTYIIGGNNKGGKFLMVDNYTNNDINEERVEKILRSRRYPNTFWSMSGSPFLINSILIYETHCMEYGIDFDFNLEFINTILTEFIYICEKQDETNPSYNRIFRITDESIKCCEIIYKKNTYELIHIKFIDIDENEFLMNFQDKQNIDEEITDLKSFCSNKLDEFRKVNYAERDFALDFINDISFYSDSKGLELNEDIKPSTLRELIDFYLRES